MDHRTVGAPGIPVLSTSLTAEFAVADAFVARFDLEPAASGPLAGTTFAAKDLFDVAGFITGFGNPCWRASHPPAARHAAAIDRLLAAGARCVGKTRTDEFAYSLEGRNAHEGAPLNPAAPACLTGGSSSGTASAVAAGKVDFGLATDTAGSVRVPAAWCGVLGFRPTHARVSVGGSIPLAPSFDTVGWMARSGGMLDAVGDVLLRETAATNGNGTAPPRAPRAQASGRERSGSNPARSAGLRILVDPVLAPVEPGIDAEFAIGLEPVRLGLDLRAAAEALRILQGREVWRTHGEWVNRVNPRFGAAVGARIAAARALTEAEELAAAQVRAALIARLDELLPPGTLWCLPAVPVPPPPRAASAAFMQTLRARLFPLTAVASLTGRPQLVLPRRADALSMPLAASLLGWRGGDEVLLRFAAEHDR